MTVVRERHEDHGASFREVAGRALPEEYGRPERTHRAVRNVVGITEHAFDVVVVEGEDRHEFVDDTVTNRVPTEDGEGVYALLLDPQGRIRADCYVFATGDSLLVFFPAGEGEAVAEEWSERTFVQDVDVEHATDRFGVFGAHGPKATEKIASVLGGASPPEEPLRFVRGSMEEGVTVIRDDDLAGEEGYIVVCAAADAGPVFETLVVRGLNATPFGRRTWETLTLEAGTPLFATELEGRIPNVLGLGNAVDYEKGCFVGQEVVSKVQNRGQPSSRLVGLVSEELPEAGAAVTRDGDDVGEITRAAVSPLREGPVAFAEVDYGVSDGSLTVETEDGDVSAEVSDLPFVDCTGQSARIPAYDGSAE
ncbi:aminomethyltransferase family protein [Halobacterium sp. R2-5]|uniref:CAF17-like 4Fe-4S cluster assembly/insertion protein YgfZ n=1 Tax=Halobacterium sp. R2-5 TaxID=2715751 RepID=UPI0014222302|nr:aminomethyltransferase family protein [Halobacterium sp. R2-5]NIB98447.1 aminomethyl transferase family protein [Halobacterium sp. R2-5]